MFRTTRVFSVSACLFVGLCALPASALEYVFPPSAKVIDVTQAPYNADKTGQTDVSAILSKAANDDINIPNWCPRFLYLPRGTYLVKNTFGWKMNGTGNGNGPVLIGQSRTGTVIKLAKGTWPLGTELKGVIQTGAGVEQNFNKSIRNLTVLVDSNNAGAIGIIYISNNVGMMSDVDVISADGKGAYGIQSSGGLSGVGGNGPFIIRRTFVKGFQTGIRVGCSQGAVASQIRLQGQTRYGIWITGGDLSLDSLTSNDTCPAIQAESPIMLTHAVLTGGGSTQYAIRNFQTSSYFNDVVTSGYRAAISSVGTNRPTTAASFAEYTPVPPSTLFPSPARTMNLPAKYAPEVAWENDMTKWASIDDYKTGGRNDAQALQAAIDDPTKTTVCLPNKVTRSLTQPIYVRGTIRRIIGTGSDFGTVNLSTSQIIIDDGSAPAVILQNFGYAADINNKGQIIKRTNRTAIIETGEDGFDIVVTGGGETYLTDLSLCNYVIDNPSARVYAWQIEGHNFGDSTVVVRNGMFRLVGFYHEASGTRIVCDGGFTEILGNWIYATLCNNSGRYLLVVRNSANVSAAGVFQQNFCSPWSGYTRLVSETRNGVTKVLGNAAGVGDVVCASGGNIALFTGYDSAQVKNFITTDARNGKPFATSKEFRFSVARTPAGVEVLYSVPRPGPVTLLASDPSGRIIASVKEGSAHSGIHRTLLPGSARFGGILCIELRAQGKSASRLLVP